INMYRRRSRPRNIDRRSAERDMRDYSRDGAVNRSPYAQHGV
ncbi:hypothetical protein KIPB_014837, partial [Kipferlia bialata]